MDPLDEWGTEELIYVFGDPGFETHTERLKGLFHRVIFDLLRLKLKDAQKADEAQSLFWEKVLRGKDIFLATDSGSGYRWMCTVARNAAKDYRRAEKKSNSLSGPDALDNVPSPDSEEEPTWRNQAAEDEVERVIPGLSRERQVILMLTKPSPRKKRIGLGNLPLRAVAECLGVSSPAGVLRNLKSTLKQLKRLAKPSSNSGDQP